MTRSLLIFAKPPRIGLAKTRLARGIGPACAQRIAVFCTARTLRAAQDPRWRSTLYITPDTFLTATLGGLWPAGMPRASQGDGDLTARLNKALAEASAGPVLFVGADAPDLSKRLIWSAFQALRTHDAVFGPATDGGFWLFGMNKTRRAASPFAPVRWSSPHAMADVRANLPDGARIAELPALIDIDEARDWSAWNRSRRDRIPQT